jgi:hypothetical protein
MGHSQRDPVIDEWLRGSQYAEPLMGVDQLTGLMMVARSGELPNVSRRGADPVVHGDRAVPVHG